ncbi:Aste57867_15028 [Aphanomyces stellatus]|uniref:Aste57867_15028 protein n=1 Tax=Aphanomyces stellatus TaxID=120398 RepID=A0A485L360_9STRA|nr:hypothetical protein As57867_014972 [Aphanomyces stellatus]VFT91842.1 Aste57867_15028 [Aphanomyces stellatus]
MIKVTKKKNLTAKERLNILQHLLLLAKTPGGRLKKGQAAMDVQARIVAVPQARRYCFRSLAHAMKIPKSTLHYYYKNGVIAKYSSYLKPTLTTSNKVARLKWALDRVKYVQSAKYFDDMFRTRETKVVYGAPGEKVKRRSCKSKRHLLMVMFLSAVARPRWDNVRKLTWKDVKMSTLNKNFITLQSCLQEVIRIGGCNDYKILHLKKDV